MTLDPYAELGVGKNAGPEAIKAAHRRAVKKAHPDSGGTPEDFDRVQRSYVILADPAKRDKYDRTGQTDHDSVGAQEAQLRDALAHVIEQALSVPIDWTTNDLGQVVRDQLKAVREQIETAQMANTKAQAKLASIRRRFKKKAGASTMHAAMLEQAFEGKQQWFLRQAEEQQTALDLNAQVGAVFESFTYDFEAMPTYVTLGGLRQGADFREHFFRPPMS